MTYEQADKEKLKTRFRDPIQLAIRALNKTDDGAKLDQLLNRAFKAIASRNIKKILGRPMVFSNGKRIPSGAYWKIPIKALVISMTRKALKTKAIYKFKRNRGTWVVEWDNGHAVFADLKRARAFKDGYNEALKPL